MTEDELFTFIDEDMPVHVKNTDSPWRILIVDDDPDVHSTTTLALKSLIILDHPLELLHASSAAEATDILRAEGNSISVILLDVVMETPDAGLRLANTIRNELGITEARIILRTGQPGHASEIEVIREYDINDYCTKAELTRNKLYVSLTTAIRSYEQIHEIGASRRGLDLILRAFSEMTASEDVRQFSTGLAAQMVDLLSHNITQREQAKQAVVRLITDMEEQVAERTAELDRARQVAEDASNAKSRFLAVMSHEIRTPINGIVGILELLDRKVVDREQKDMLATAQFSANLLLHIINDILDFSKIDGGHLTLEALPFSLSRTVRAVGDAMESLAAHRQINLIVDLAADLPHRVIGDSFRLSQILMNFLSNAFKFTPAGGTVTLRATRAIEEIPDNPWVRLQVIDTGPGIPADVQARLFSPFIQADASVARRFGGTGLGLAICQRLAFLMGGTVDVSSQVGAGATFSILIPFVPAGHVATADAPASIYKPAPLTPLPMNVGAATLTPPRTKGTRHRLLVADDNAVNLDLIAKQLDELGYDYDLAQDGDAVLAMYDAGRHALILTDCEMPGTDGFVLTEKIRARERAQATGVDAQPPHVPIIALTAHVLAGDAAHCLATGMDEVIVKPVSLATLADRLAHWLDPSVGQSEPVSEEHIPSSPPASMDFDATALARFVGVEPNEQVRFLRKFARSLEDWVPLINTLVTDAEWDKLRAEAHRMKSSARAIGASRLADHCQAIEDSVKSGVAEHILSLHQGLPSLLSLLVAALEMRSIEVPSLRHLAEKST